MPSFWENPFSSLRRIMSPYSPSLRQIRHQYSPILDRELAVDVYLPPDYRRNKHHKYPLLIVNDGQDLPRMDMTRILENLYRRKKIPSIIVVGIHADENRMREYGTGNQPDYKGRGERASVYKSFIINELLAFLMNRFRISGLTEETAIAGFSLGGLSAFDIAWAVPQIFGTVGVFSGALWWRSREVNPKAPDADRIMHTIVQNSTKNEGQYFWFEAGTDDETDDRNNNGVIDAIDDTLDLMAILQEKGYSDEDLRYIEIPNGRHDPQTWGVAMPDFLIWTFGGDAFKLN
jgi:enterochelin esterase-like enzyme